MEQILEIRVLICGFLSALSVSVLAQTTTSEKNDSLQGKLQGITVNAERTDMKVQDGTISYDLNRIAQRYTVDNVWEALARLPGITEKDNTYQLTGQEVTIILNGKPTTMTQEQLSTLLKNTPVNRVERVEVLQTAPPQYHIREAAINVLLKQSRFYSVQGEIHGDYFNRFFNYGNIGGSVRASSPKVTLDVMYNAGRKKNIQAIELYSRHTLNGKVYALNQEQELRMKKWTHDLHAALDWHISGHNDLNMSYTGNYSPENNSNSRTNGNFQKSEVNSSGSDYMHNFSLAYLSGFGLQLGGDYTYYKTHDEQSLAVDYASGKTTSLQVYAGQRVDRYKLFVDQSFKLRRNWNLGFGGSYTYVYDRDYQFYGNVEGQLDTPNTNTFQKEHTADFYVSVGKNYRAGTSFSVSATGEYYKLGAYQNWSVYPQASFTYVLSSTHIFQLGISTDKTYPSYWDMQSSVSYLDGYSEVRGTPGLRPYNQYNATASYIFHQKYVLALFYKRSNDYFQQAAYQSTEHLALIYQRLNWNYSQQAGIQAVLPFSITDWYNLRATLVGLQLHQRADNYHDISFNRQKWVGLVVWNNSFRFNKHLLLNVDGVFQSPAIQGTYDVGTSFNASVSAKYTFANGRASISLKCADVFNSEFPHTKVRFGQQYLDLDTGRYNRSVRIHFSYSFGNYKKKEVKEVDTSRFGH